MTYISPKTGLQYVLVAVPDGGGAPFSAENAAREELDDGEVEGGYVIAYRLP